MRDGARVSKIYHPPLSPCDRLLGLSSVSEATKTRLRDQFKELDPVRLLHEIRIAQQTLADFAANGTYAKPPPAATLDVASFMSNLSKAWQQGEV